MTERLDQAPKLEPAERAPMTTGDRLMVLLAGGALVAGLLVAVGNAVFPGPDEVAVVSPSGLRSARPTPSRPATPVPGSLGLILVAPGEPPQVDDPGVASWEGWIRTLEELVIRFEPREDAQEIGRLAVGEVAYATTFSQVWEPTATDWLWVNDPEPRGWVRVSRDGTAIAERYSAEPPADVGDFWSLTGGSDGFVATGNVWGPRETDGAWMAVSGDGADWSAPNGELPPNYGRWWIADGPAGWLAMSNPYPPSGRSLVWLASSADGARWTSLGALGLELHNLVPEALYGSDLGYLLVSWNGAWRQHWYSSNGRSWLEMPRPDFLDFTDTEIRETAAPIGFYTWDADVRHGGAGAFTGDGARWLPTEVGPAGSSSQVVGLGDTLLGLDSDPGGSGVRVWLGHPEPDVFGWTRDADAEATLAGSALALLVADGRRAIAVTVDLDSELVRAWTTPDGHDWTPLAIPDGGFGVIPHEAASTRSETLVVGREDRNGIGLPRLWRLVGDSWDSLAFADAVPFPTVIPACPEPPTEALGFLALDHGLAARCFGSAAISFAAYVTAHPHYGDVAGGFTPEWLAADGRSWVSLSPYATDWDFNAQSVLAPTAAASLGSLPGWFQVTGHFNDPAADRCRQEWGPSSLPWYAGRADVVRECHEAFVISEVTLLPVR